MADLIGVSFGEAIEYLNTNISKHYSYVLSDQSTYRMKTVTDPFTDVSAAGSEMIAQIIEALEARAADSEMLPIVDAYLSRLELCDSAQVLDIDAGTEGITRRIAEQASHCRILGIEPSPELVDAANDRATGIDNLSFAVGDAYELESDDANFDVVISTLCSAM